MILRLPLALSIVVLLVLGCGGGGGGGKSENNSVSYGPDTRVLSADGQTRVTNVTESSVVLSGNAEPLPVGAILLSKQGDGLLRRVASASQVGDDTVLQTTPCSVTEAVSDCDVHISRSIGFSDIRSFTPDFDGVTLGAGSGGQGRAAFGLAIHIPEREFDTNPPVKISGDLNIALSVEGSLSIGLFKLKHLRLVQHVECTGIARAKIEKSQSFQKEYRIGVAEGVPFELGPVLVRPHYEFYLAVGGQLTVREEWSPEVTASLSSGIEYTQTDGWHGVADSSLTAKGLMPSNPYLGANFYVTPLNPKVSFLIDGVAGGYINASIPRVQMSLSPEQVPEPQVKLKAAAHFGASAGIEAGIFDIHIGKDLGEFFGKDVTLFEKTFAKDGSVGVGIQ